MNLIIEHSNTKRKLEAPFNLCGSRSDIQNLVDQLKEVLEDQKFLYGWVRIVSATQIRLEETSPRPWDE